MSRFAKIKKDASKPDVDEGYKLGHRDKVKYKNKPALGISEEVVREMSKMKEEPEWMLEKRLKALSVYEDKEIPEWGVDLSEIDFDEIYYYLKPTDGPVKNWDDVPENIKRTFEKIGVPQAEKEVLAGVKGQFDSEVVYGSLKKSLEKKGVIFMSMDEGLRKHPKIVKKYMSTVVPVGDNKLAALNTAVWSGGSFIYVPEGVEVGMPLQAYFRINAERAGQFERTLIVAEKGSKVKYYEGCSAPVYSSGSLHAAVVEIVVEESASVEYTTVQNWYRNVYNLVTKRAIVKAGGSMRWVDGNLGSKVTMKYPSCVLAGEGARGETLSIAWGGDGQQIDAGAKMIHLAPRTSSQIISKSISKGGGRASYRGLVQINKGAENSKSKVVCDALILDEKSRSDTYPTNRIFEKNVSLEHEATVSRVGEEQLFYLMSRGLPEHEAEAMVINGFLEPVMREVPLEYAVEINKLIKFEMEGSVG